MSRAKSPEPVLTTLRRPDAHQSESSSDDSSEDDEDDDGGENESEVPVYEIERIEATKVLPGGKRAFFVRWWGYGNDDRTWEPEQALKEDVPVMLKKYLARGFAEPRANLPRATLDKGKGKAKRAVEDDDESKSDGLSLVEPAARANKKAKSNGPSRPLPRPEERLADLHLAKHSAKAGPSAPKPIQKKPQAKLTKKPARREKPRSESDDSSPPPRPARPVASTSQPPAVASRISSLPSFKRAKPPPSSHQSTGGPSVTPALDRSPGTAAAVLSPPRPAAASQPTNPAAASSLPNPSPVAPLKSILSSGSRDIKPRRATATGPFFVPPPPPASAVRFSVPAEVPAVPAAETRTFDPRKSRLPPSLRTAAPVASTSTSAAMVAPAPEPPARASSPQLIDLSERRLRSSSFFDRHFALFSSLALPLACARALVVPDGIALSNIARKWCSVVNASGLQSDPREGGESWALACLLSSLESKQPRSLDDIQIVFLHREEASFDVLAPSMINLTSRQSPFVDFFAYSATKPLARILSSGWAVVPTLSAISQIPAMMAFLKVRDNYPHANVILHPASVILASTPANLFSDVQLRELMKAGELTVVDPKKLSPASPLYGNITLDELNRGKLLSPPVVSLDSELSDIQRHLMHLRAGLPNNYRRFVIVSYRHSPDLAQKCASLGIELKTWNELGVLVISTIF